KMGYAIAEQAINEGAEVILISGPTSLTPPVGCTLIPVVSTKDMYDAVLSNLDVDVIIKAAAPADYKPAHYSESKIKKNDSVLNMAFEKNPDILKRVGELKTNQIVVGFAAETDDVETYAKRKLLEKNLDFIVANDVTQEGAGFNTDTNIVTIYDKEGGHIDYTCMEKAEVAKIILNKVIERL
ncbi:MAG TPA: bifunctional 4'-phosphopantothenoylcysteine decarboxylase/phosphopantothenoylcysteine synthetase, partial [Clostridiales bacterium UBA8960]|nr:bifunctional 4'-phosphopantothenoylcysteine decarboxylase/phosphopantothenoylcysteine synthetase [Clostridiales bacterium UBA8960]